MLSPNYLTLDNLLIMASHVAIYAILGMGMLLVILNGGIDLSVGSTLGFTGIIAGFLLRGVEIDFLGITFVPSVPVVVLLSCAVGAAVGFVNGILVSRFKVAPFVATLGMLYAVRGIALLMTNGLTVNDLSGDPALGNTGFDWLGFNRILNVPMGVIFMILIAGALGLLLGRARFGRWLYASGGNERAAELSGVPVVKVKIWVYVVSGTCAGIGRGNVRGTLLGAFVIGFLSDGLVIVGVSAYWQMVFTGVVIVGAVLLNGLQYGRRPKKSSTDTSGGGKTALADKQDNGPATNPDHQLAPTSEVSR